MPASTSTGSSRRSSSQWPTSQPLGPLPSGQATSTSTRRRLERGRSPHGHSLAGRSIRHSSSSPHNSTRRLVSRTGRGMLQDERGCSLLVFVGSLPVCVRMMQGMTACVAVEVSFTLQDLTDALS